MAALRQGKMPHNVTLEKLQKETNEIMLVQSFRHIMTLIFRGI